MNGRRIVIATIGETGSAERVRDVDPLVIRKVFRRIIPFIMVLYFFAYLDRVNISFASLQMNAELGFSGAVYGFGASLFFVGYFLFEVPSNLVMTRVGARLWIARILITWGLIS